MLRAEQNKKMHYLKNLYWSILYLGEAALSIHLIPMCSEDGAMQGESRTAAGQAEGTLARELQANHKKDRAASEKESDVDSTEHQKVGTSQLRCFHSSICPCQKLEVCFLLQSIFSASLKEDRERGKQCNCGLLTWLSYWQCPRLLSNTPVINFTKDPLPSDYFFSNTLACQDKEWLFAESKNESVRVQGAVKSLLGHTAEHCQIWHGVDMSKLLRDFTQIFLGEMTEALHRGLEVVLEGSCVVFQTHLWKW